MIIKLKAVSDYKHIVALINKLKKDDEFQVNNIGQIRSNYDDIGVYDKKCFIELEFKDEAFDKYKETKNNG